MIRIATTGSTATVTFPYEEQAVDIIRGIPGRRWNGDRRSWQIDTNTIRLAATRFHAAGFDVTIDGKPYTPADTPRAHTSTAGSPLVALFAWLPQRLRQPVYRALARVLHPDVGGDTALMQQLNNAMKERQ